MSGFSIKTWMSNTNKEILQWLNHLYRIFQFKVSYPTKSEEIPFIQQQPPSIIPLPFILSSKEKKKKTWMSDYDILANKSVPIIVTSVAIFYAIWRKFHPGNQTYCYKVNDATKGTISFSLNVKDLPCEVSSHILSYISIDDVARMSILSRHWRNVCLSLPCLDLDWFAVTGANSEYHTSDCESYAQAYVKGVDKVLEMYSRHDPNILSFHLSCCLNAKMYGDDIDRWMNFVAVNKGSLQSLTLQFICDDNLRTDFDCEDDELYLVSGSFLSQFSYLKILHLDTCFLTLENKFTLTNLTTLDLNNVTVEGNQWQGVFSCSSTLKCLWLRRCKLPSKLCIDNNFPRLSFLMIGACRDLRELKVGASKLQRFDLHILEDLKCSFVNVPNLERVYFFPQGVSCVEDILNILAAKVHSLIYLFIRGVYTLMDKLPLNTACKFYSVSSLRISMKYDDGKILTGLSRLLKSLPQLKKLEMKMDANGKPKRPLEREEREFTYHFKDFLDKTVREYPCLWRNTDENHYIHMRRMEALSACASEIASVLRDQWEEIVAQRKGRGGTACLGSDRVGGHYHLSPTTECWRNPIRYAYPYERPLSPVRLGPARQLNYSPPSFIESPPVEDASPPRGSYSPSVSVDITGYSSDDIEMWVEDKPPPEIIEISSDEEDDLVKEMEGICDLESATGSNDYRDSDYSDSSDSSRTSSSSDDSY